MSVLQARALGLVVCVVSALLTHSACAHAPQSAISARLRAIPHAQSFTDEVHWAIAGAQAQGVQLHKRLLAVPSSMRLAYTGGQKNFNFLTVGVAHLGMQVSALAKTGEISRYFPAENIATLPSEDLFVAEKDVALLIERVAALAAALDRWRLAPSSPSERATTFQAFAAAMPLLFEQPSEPSIERTKVSALDALPSSSPLYKTLELLVFGTRVRRASDIVQPDVCLVDLTHETLAVLLSGVGERARIVWYVQNVGHDVDDAILAHEVDVAVCSASTLSDKFAHIALTRPAHVIPNGIAMQRFVQRPRVLRMRAAHGIPPGALVVGQIAALLPHKDPLLIVEAMARVIDVEPNAYLVLVGGLLAEDYVETLKARAHKLGIEGHVLFLGERDDVAELLYEMDAVVSASHSEGYGLSVAEAMTAGCALVLTQIPPFETLAGDAALYFPVGDANALATQIVSLTNKEKRAQLRAAASMRAKRTVHSQTDMLVTFANMLREMESDPSKH